MRLANDAIKNNPSIYKNGKIVSESYNGQIAAFSVSVALSGIKPAVAIYYSEKSGSDVDKKVIIQLLATIYSMDKGTQIDADAFYSKIIKATGDEEANLKRNIIKYAIALKLAVRTFKFK